APLRRSHAWVDPPSPSSCPASCVDATKPRRAADPSGAAPPFERQDSTHRGRTCPARRSWVAGWRSWVARRGLRGRAWLGRRSRVARRGSRVAGRASRAAWRSTCRNSRFVNRFWAERAADCASIRVDGSVVAVGGPLALPLPLFDGRPPSCSRAFQRARSRRASVKAVKGPRVTSCSRSVEMCRDAPWGGIDRERRAEWAACRREWRFRPAVARAAGLSARCRPGRARSGSRPA
ncbi:MAG: hypothetical protein QOH61_119, partial [Chloroflexota bacterium]|nr:hypothetical protein [Chloroflexota bacterium]